MVTGRHIKAVVPGLFIWIIIFKNYSKKKNIIQSFGIFELKNKIGIGKKNKFIYIYYQINIIAGRF